MLSGWERRYERKAARRYWHMTHREQPCWRHLRGACWHCVRRILTGAMRRDRAAQRARFRRIQEWTESCTHERREPGRQPMFEWHCLDCPTSKTVPRPARP